MILKALLLLATAAVATAPKSQVAIVPFQGDDGISGIQAATITDRFQTELMGTQAFVILDRQQMDVILQEQGFVQSGLCQSSECQVQMGQMLGVDKIISGRIARFDQIHVLTLSYVDVGSGQVMQTFSYETAFGLGSILGDACQEVAKQLRAFTLGQPFQAVVSKQISKTADSLAQVDSVQQAKAAAARQALAAEKEKKAQSARTAKWVALATGVAGAGVVAFGVVTDLQAKDKYQAYSDLPRGTSEGDFAKSYKDYEDLAQRRNLLYGIGGALLATGVIIYVAF